MNTRDIELPPEFRSGNGIPVERATITRERMAEILSAATQPAEPGGYVHTVPDDCETLHWRGQILSLNELATTSAEPVEH